MSLNPIKCNICKKEKKNEILSYVASASLTEYNRLTHTYKSSVATTVPA